MHKTTDQVPLRAIYNPSCGCADVAVPLRRGQTFPACPKCGKAATWFFSNTYPAELYQPPSPPTRAPQRASRPPEGDGPVPGRGY